MNLYVILRDKGNMTHNTSVVLSLKQHQKLFNVGLPGYLSPVAGLPVFAQVRVVGAVTPSDLCVASNRRFGRFNQFVFAVVKRPPAVIPEITGFHPFARFVGMATFSPLPQHLPLAMAHFGKYFFGRTMPVVISPAPDNRVKGVNYFSGLFLLMAAQIGFDAPKVFNNLLFLRFGQQGAMVEPSDVETQEVEPFIYVNKVGFGFTQLQATLPQKLHQLWFDIGFQYLLRRGCYHKVIGITYQIQPFVMPFTQGWCFEFAVWPFGLKQSLHPVKRNVRQQGRDYPALWRASFSVGVVTKFHYSSFEPASYCGGKYTQFCQEWLVSDVVKAATNVSIEYPLARPLTGESSVDGFDCILAISSRPETIGISLEFGFPFRFKDHFDDRLHYPVFHSWYPQRALPSVAFRDVNPTHRFGLVSFEAQSFIKKLYPVLGRVAYHAINACGVFAPVFLRNTPNSQELSRSGSNQQLLKVFDLIPLLVLGSTVNSLLQPTYNRFYSEPIHFRPFPVGVSDASEDGWLLWGLFSLHRLTSPQITSFQVFQYRQDQSDVSTLSGWVSVPCEGSPIRLITSRPLLFLTSHSLCTFPRSYDWVTALWAGCIGVIQLVTEKMRTEEVGICVPVGISIVVATATLLQTYPLTILVTVCQPLLPFAAHGTLRRYFAHAQPFSSSLVHYYTEASSFGSLSPKLRTLDYSFARSGRDTWTIQGSPYGDTFLRPLPGSSVFANTSPAGRNAAGSGVFRQVL